MLTRRGVSVGLPSARRSTCQRPEIKTTESDTTKAEVSRGVAFHSLGFLLPRARLKYSRTTSEVVARLGMVVPQNNASGQNTPTTASTLAAVKAVRNLSKTACASSFGPAYASVGETVIAIANRTRRNMDEPPHSVIQLSLDGSNPTSAVWPRTQICPILRISSYDEKRKQQRWQIRSRNAGVDGLGAMMRRRAPNASPSIPRGGGATSHVHKKGGGGGGWGRPKGAPPGW